MVVAAKPGAYFHSIELYVSPYSSVVEHEINRAWIDGPCIAVIVDDGGEIKRIARISRLYEGRIDQTQTIAYFAHKTLQGSFCRIIPRCRQFCSIPYIRYTP